MPIPTVAPLDPEKMEITLERHSNSSFNNSLDMPFTQIVDDAQLVMPCGKPLNPSARGKGKSLIQFRKTVSVEVSESLKDSQCLQLPKPKAVSFVTKQHTMLESIEESPGSVPNLNNGDGKELNFEKCMEENSSSLIPSRQDKEDENMEEDNEDDEEDGLPKT